MIGSIVARRYAKALFSIAMEKGGKAAQEYGEGLGSLTAVLEEFPGLLAVFSNPVFSSEEKKATIDKVLSKLGVSGVVKTFCFLLADKGRLAEVPEIEAYYRVLLDRAQGILRGELITAVPLDDATQKSVKSQLAAQVGKELVLHFRKDEDILGGIVLQVGDRVLDGSLRAQLGAIKEQIKRGE